MTKPPSFLKETFEVDGRQFVVQVIEFENGRFISVSEGSERIGSMVVSLSSGPTPITTTVIPAKTDGLFMKLTAERISSKTRGIAIVSAFFQRELDSNSAKLLMSKIMDLMTND